MAGKRGFQPFSSLIRQPRSVVLMRPGHREVFEMVTKRTTLDGGASEEPGDRQHTKPRRRLQPFALVAAIVVAAPAGAVSCSSGEGAAPPSSGEGAAPPVEQPIGPSVRLYAVHDETGTQDLLMELPLSGEGSEDMAVSRTNGRIAYVANVDGHNQIFVANTRGGDRRQLTQDASGAESPAWSPDGSQIAYRGVAPDGSSEVYVIDVEGAAPPTRITREPTDVGDGLAWSPDGTVIFYQSERDDGQAVIRSIDVVSGRTTTIVQDAGYPTVSPDGTRIAFNTWSSARVTLADIDGSARRIISPGEAALAKWSPDGQRIAWLQGDGHTYVYDVASAETRRVAAGEVVDWIDDQTLLVLVE
jgi:dipeptidyl aminopeptidase/acylaminoacyl peptidase